MSRPLDGLHEEAAGSTTALELWVHGTELEIHISYGDEGLSMMPSREQALAVAKHLTDWAGSGVGGVNEP